MTLAAAMRKLHSKSIWELFAKFDTLGMRKFDARTLSRVLTSLGVNLSQFELDMVI